MFLATTTLAQYLGIDNKTGLVTVDGKEAFYLTAKTKCSGRPTTQIGSLRRLQSEWRRSVYEPATRFRLPSDKSKASNHD